MLESTFNKTVIVRTETGREARLPAEPITVLGLEDYKFFIHPKWVEPDTSDDEDEDYDDNDGYSITEQECGFAIVHEGTKLEAIYKANNLVEQYGRDECVRRIEAGIKHVRETMKHPLWLACKDAGFILTDIEVTALYQIMSSRGLLSERIS